MGRILPVKSLDHRLRGPICGVVVDEPRSSLLGHSPAPMESLEAGDRDRPARDCRSLAPARIQAVLATEEPKRRLWTADDRPGDPSPGWKDGLGKPILGRTEDSWRASQATNRDLANDGRQVHAEIAPATLSVLASFFWTITSRIWSRSTSSPSPPRHSTSFSSSSLPGCR